MNYAHFGSPLQPEDCQGDFVCEACDRSWTTSEELEAHVACHVTCDAEGCTFAAHEKVVELHYKMQHVTGLFNRIPKTSDSKDIAEWIAERKKRYPTKERVDEKEEERLEKIARGEVLENPLSQPKLSSQPKDIRSKRCARDPNKRAGKRPRRNTEIARCLPHFVVGDMMIEIVDGLPPDYEKNKREAALERALALEHAAAAASAKEGHEVVDDDDEITDDEIVAESTKMPPDSSKTMCSVLSALCAAYDSNLSDEDGPPKDVKVIVSKASEDGPLNDLDNKSVEHKVNTEATPQVGSEPRHSRGKPRRKRDDSKKLPLPAPPSLLEKLLAKEIRKERNQILQCVRYIVENHYFDSDKGITSSGALQHGM